ncbi:Voltage-gated potassium channel subunit beta-2 [Fasciola hepatica]|uniref:Voltage-gated potassium channel subunit beta-2 n=1 Tax=Fasciola hepatica TaxID=6192 RepID=A0A4E0RFS0_FASHE|nr:Voltage-gated potassium channel subunit beta-2 [Fasciola hepatica]
MSDTKKFTMPYRQLGCTGLRVSAISLGTNVTFGQQISDEMAEKIAVYAYKQGVNMFETCECYGDGAAEVTLGKILKNQNWRRSSYIISVRISRGGPAVTEQGLSRKHIIEGLQNALERLQLDYVDILLVTRHPEFPNPTEEVVRTCTYLIEKGWAFYWGTSKWSSTEIMIILFTSNNPLRNVPLRKCTCLSLKLLTFDFRNFVTHKQAQSIARQFNLIPSALDQSEYHMFQRDFLQHIQEMSTKLNLGLITGSPLAGGLLTGKYLDGIPAYSRASLKGQTVFLDRVMSCKDRLHSDQIRQLVHLASRIKCTCAQLAIAWCLRTPFVSSVLIGAATVDQLQENLESITVLPRLSLAVLTEIECILTPDSSEGFL